MAFLEVDIILLLPNSTEYKDCVSVFILFCYRCLFIVRLLFVPCVIIYILTDSYTSV